MPRPRDLLWLLAYPVYQLIGTLRHEGSHALMARIEGARILEFVVVPRIDDRRGLLWGYVRYDGGATWLTTAAPYLADLLTYAVFLVVCLRLRNAPRWLRLNLVIVGMLSPFVDTAYAYAGGLFRPYNDVAVLLRTVPPWTVHVCFAAAIAGYVAGLVAVFRATPSPRSRRR